MLMLIVKMSFLMLEVVHSVQFMKGCLGINVRVNGTQACEEHQRAWQKHINNHQPGTLAGVQRMLRRPGENLEWFPAPREHVNNPHDGLVLPDRQIKNYFSPNHFYCVETICAPCGIVVAWTKFAKSESPSNMRSLNLFIQHRKIGQPIFALTRLVWC